MTEKINVLINRAQVGDIIRSPSFAFGVYKLMMNEERHLVPTSEIDVDGVTTTYIGHYRNPNITEENPSRLLPIETAAYDESRGAALFRVTRAYSPGEISDDYERGWYVKAERIEGPEETINFCQNGSLWVIPEVELVERSGKKLTDLINEL